MAGCIKQDRKKKDKYLEDFIYILNSISSFWKANSKSNNEHIEMFFNERLTMVNINAFYMMFKNNYSYSEIINYKSLLYKSNLLYLDFTVRNGKKNLFRKIMLGNFFLFRISQPIKRMLKI